MLSLAALIWRDATLRMVAAGILLFGTFASSVGIHQSLIAVDGFGLTDGEYAVVLALAMAVSVAASIWVGIVTDQKPKRRRRMATLAALAMVAGPLLVWFGAHPLAFVAAHVLLVPLAGTIFGQLFAVARLASAPHPPSVRDGLLGVLRALFAVPFALVLPVWGFALNEDVSLLTIYPAVALAGAALLLLVRMAWPAEAEAPREARSGLGFLASLRELAAGPVMLRVALMGAVHAGGAIAGIVLGLVFARAGRPVGDVGLFFGLFVAVEIAATLGVGLLVRHVPRLVLVAAGTVVYAAFLASLPFLAASAWVWVLILPAGVGGALIYTLAIGYLQDLLAARPGAGASLIALQRVSAEGLTTAVYGIGAYVQGYATVAVLGGVVAVAAVAAILRLDGPRWAASEEARARLGQEAPGHGAALGGAVVRRDGGVVGEDAAAVGAQDLAPEPQAAPLDLGQARDGRLAGAVEGREEGALGRKALARRRVVDQT